MARQGYGNACFEIGTVEGLGIVEEFSKSEHHQLHDLTHVQDILKRLKQSV